jgi:predicted outer membrane repeat protein
MAASAECNSWINLRSLVSNSENLTVTLDPNFKSDYDSEIILRGKRVVIFGNGAIVDAGSQGNMFQLLSGSELELHSITLKNGYTADGYGGAIYACGGSTFTIYNSILAKKIADGGDAYAGAIYACGDSTIRIYNSTLADNSADGDGGAILTDGGTVNIHNSILKHNSAYDNGGAIFADGGSTISIYNSTLTHNSAFYGGFSYGGAIYADGCIISVHNSILKHNTADGGGAIYASGDTITITDSTMHNNSANGNTAIFAGKGNTSVLFKGVHFSGPNSVARYDASNVTFACADSQNGAPFTMTSSELDNPPPPS